MKKNLILIFSNKKFIAWDKIVIISIDIYSRRAALSSASVSLRHAVAGGAQPVDDASAVLPARAARGRGAVLRCRALHALWSSR